MFPKRPNTTKRNDVLVGFTAPKPPSYEGNCEERPRSRPCQLGNDRERLRAMLAATLPEHEPRTRLPPLPVLELRGGPR